MFELQRQNIGKTETTHNKTNRYTGLFTKTRRHARFFAVLFIELLNNPGGVRGGAPAPPRVAGGVRGQPPRRIENL